MLMKDRVRVRDDTVTERRIYWKSNFRTSCHRTSNHRTPKNNERHISEHRIGERRISEGQKLSYIHMNRNRNTDISQFVSLKTRDFTVLRATRIEKIRETFFHKIREYTRLQFPETRPSLRTVPRIFLFSSSPRTLKVLKVTLQSDCLILVCLVYR